MLRWTLTFFVVAIIAIVFGFSGIIPEENPERVIVRAVALASLLLFVICLVVGAFRKDNTGNY